MVMSAITVRANMRMMFDDSSANKMQTSYMSRLSRMERAATESTKKTNKKLISEHDATIKRLEASDNKAKEKLKNRSKDIVNQVKANAAAAQKAMKPDGRAFKGGLASKAYKKQMKEYKATLAAMDAANKKYVRSAAALGIKAKGGSFNVGDFAENDAAKRKQAITLMRRQVALEKKGSKEKKAAIHLLIQMEDANELLIQQERVKNAKLKENNIERRKSQIMTDRGIAKNNAMLREQLRLFSQINGTITRMSAQLQGAFLNALMVSGIALMTFAFRLQGVVDTFKDFEKELMNAQSIFQTTNETLFSLSDQIVSFGTKYGISFGTASEGLYTLASAGLSAADSQEVLANTLKLSMAVQGDHETIAKLTTQTIFGFNLKMSDSAELTDKFAHAINKSLIEYQDLASAVKFAMPFFITTGQNIDQLLGSLEILTNRALEAGIAGRGLRQALSEFAQHAEDNTAAFAKLGVKVTDANGNFLMLTEIAKNFQNQFSHVANDTELLTTLLEDLNVRGATAFVHLVQNADEFQIAVDDLANSAGAATEMADIQQKSLANQIQVVKNALMAPFLLSDELGRANGHMNTFGDTLHTIVQDFEAFFIQTAPDGTRNLTEMGEALRDTAIVALDELSGLLKQLLTMFANMNTEGASLAGVFHALLLPIRFLVSFVNALGSNGFQMIMMFKILNSVLPLTEIHTLANMLATEGLTNAEKANVTAKRAMAFEMLKMHGAFMLGIVLMNHENKTLQNLGVVLMGVAGAYAAVAVAKAAALDAGKLGILAIPLAAAAGFALVAGLGLYTKNLVSSSQSSMSSISSGTSGSLNTSAAIYDMGGRLYDTGALGIPFSPLSLHQSFLPLTLANLGLGGRHFPVMVEPGETIVPKTQNMLSGTGSGITLNIAGDIVTNDAEDFAERIAVALPEALRRQSDMGGIY